MVRTSLDSCFRVWVRFFEASASAFVSSLGFFALGSPHGSSWGAAVTGGWAPPGGAA